VVLLRHGQQLGGCDIKLVTVQRTAATTAANTFLEFRESQYRARAFFHCRRQRNPVAEVRESWVLEQVVTQGQGPGRPVGDRREGRPSTSRTAWIPSRVLQVPQDCCVDDGPECCQSRHAEVIDEVDQQRPVQGAGIVQQHRGYDPVPAAAFPSR